MADHINGEATYHPDFKSVRVTGRLLYESIFLEGADIIVKSDWGERTTVTTIAGGWFQASLSDKNMDVRGRRVTVIMQMERALHAGLTVT